MGQADSNVMLGFQPAIWVDPANGDNGAATRYGNIPARTLTKAKTLAKSGDWIVVAPGIYNETNLAKDGVNWHFMPGAKVIYSGATNKAIFDDEGNELTFKVTGAGYFESQHNTGAAAGYGGILALNSSLSVCFFECDQMILSGSGAGSDVWMTGIWIKNCERCYVRVRRMYSDPGGTPAYGMVYWEKGEFWMEAEEITTTPSAGGTFGIYAKEPTGNPNTNFYLTVGLLNIDQYGAVLVEGANSNYKVWIRALEIRGLGNTGLTDGCLTLKTNGKLYVEAQKIAALDGQAIFVSGGEAWFNVQKITCTLTANLPAGIAQFLKITGGEIHLECMDYESLGTFTGEGMNIGAGTTAWLVGGEMNILNGEGIISGGLVHAHGMKIRTSNTNNAANDCVFVSNNGSVFRDCWFVAAALANSIDAAAAQTVKCMGCAANIAVSANITVQVQALVVDANVT